MQTVLANGIQLAYRDEGEGLPLLLVHAFPLSGAMWQPQLNALASRYRVIVPDLRGFGASELGAGVESLDQYADDLNALLEHLGVQQAALAGLSMGGYIAFAFLRKYADRVNALVLADTKAAADTEEARQKREQNARLVETEGLGVLADQMLPNLLAAHTADEQREIVRGIIVANKPEGIAAALRAMAKRPDSTAMLSEIAIPTLVIVGSEDMLTPPSAARKMHDALPNSRLVEIPGAAHLSNLEAPEAFNQALDAHFGTIGARAFGAGGHSGGAW